ncbi:isopropylmalate isomerase [Cyanobium gracile]|uniref:3-isopropylmalate dehydratase n=1 Tax=Cyanobium gracile UHCC 0281 TaxID=3110309 RepID=A0ABU5STJ7_9CYAN|nr:isopropylmalate isomerase [Cyanobium gracile]MEA5441824.1 isopropylmalate isomerase [Cyanobium gracile UHCC 0281]
MSTTPFPAGPIQRCEGRAVVVAGDDIDTDRIIPARYLKCVTFDDLAAGVFADDRTELAGGHPFDRPEHLGASILVVNRNFGCGSSREHAPQALMRWGIRAVIGESFAEIFFGNCLALGIPCLSADHDTLLALQAAIAAHPGALLQLDLEPPRVTLDAGSDAQEWPLNLPAGPRRMLVSGEWNGTAQLVAHDGELRATASRLPYLNGFAAA